MGPTSAQHDLLAPTSAPRHRNFCPQHAETCMHTAISNVFWLCWGLGSALPIFGLSGRDFSARCPRQDQLQKRIQSGLKLSLQCGNQKTSTRIAKRPAPASQTSYPQSPAAATLPENTMFSAPASSPNLAPWNIHAAITISFAAKPKHIHGAITL